MKTFHRTLQKFEFCYREDTEKKIKMYGEHAAGRFSRAEIYSTESVCPALLKDNLKPFQFDTVTATLLIKLLEERYAV